MMNDDFVACWRSLSAPPSAASTEARASDANVSEHRAG